MSLLWDAGHKWVNNIDNFIVHMNFGLVGTKSAVINFICIFYMYIQIERKDTIIFQRQHLQVRQERQLWYVRDLVTIEYKLLHAPHTTEILYIYQAVIGQIHLLYQWK